MRAENVDYSLGLRRQFVTHNKCASVPNRYRRRVLLTYLVRVQMENSCGLDTMFQETEEAFRSGSGESQVKGHIGSAEHKLADNS